MAPLLAGFFPVCQSKCPEDQAQEETSAEHKFRWPRRMLKLTGLMFWNEERPFWRTLKIARALFLVSIAIYQMVYGLKQLLRHGTFDIASSRMLVYFNWMLQAIISMGFFLYWQFFGYIGRLRKDIHLPRGCPLTGMVIKRTVLLYCSLLALTSVFYLTAFVLKCSEQSTDSADAMFDDIFVMYGYRRLFFVPLLVYAWSMYVWLAVLTFFVCVVTALQHELCAFNLHTLPKACTLLEPIREFFPQIGEDCEENVEKMADQLQEAYMTHVELANRVRNIDRTFEVYTFAMIGSNVPTTIFCLLSFMLSFRHSSWLMLAFSIPDLSFCLLELVGLTSSPAKVHARIREVESIIYGNMRIWRPFNSKIYQLAGIFVSHANQSNLGITLWGFAVVTKPLILTMISLTVTYLTFALQVHAEKSFIQIGTENGTQPVN